MKTKLAVAAIAVVTLTAGSAYAGHVAWSVGFSSGGFAAAVSSHPYHHPVAYAPAPVWVHPRRVYLRPAPVVYVPPPPVIVRRPVYVAPPPVYVAAPPPVVMIPAPAPPPPPPAVRFGVSFGWGGYCP